ncbi:hypothetical protein [Methanoregula sp.]|uniref:hypothetical protein n=1 Tax=Methanoregula sp. TaxID=2052170 RepID=UPI00236C0868|nr:hypothetical protein [Methanoregula sp.]MDD1687464.1 hypothetical protein [Methanoregula sp.]
MGLSFARIKIIPISLVIAIFVLAAGCSDNCLNGEDKNINVSVVENRDSQMNMGLTNHHNVTIKIVNTRDSPAKSVHVDTVFCNDFSPHFRKCENRSFNIRNISSNGVVQQFFEYDRTAIEDPIDGKYQIQYRVESCLPITTINNSVYIIQR